MGRQSTEERITRAQVTRVVKRLDGKHALLRGIESMDLMPDDCTPDVLRALDASNESFSGIALTGWRVWAEATLEGPPWAYRKLANNTALRCLVEQTGSFIAELCVELPKDSRKQEAGKLFQAITCIDLRAENCNRETLCALWATRDEYADQDELLPSEWALLLEITVMRQL